MLGLDSVDSVAHVIQVALTPVFLLSGIASLLGVLSTRLARVADRVVGRAIGNGRVGPAEQAASAPELSPGTLPRPRRRCDYGDFGRDRHVSRGRNPVRRHT